MLTLTQRFRLHHRAGYQKLAFDNLPHCCDECGYNKLPEILEVHHVDFNHNNNKLHNLQILCPNCHRELHFYEKLNQYHL